LIVPKPFKNGVGCVFFDSKSEWHCKIHEHRPLRCKLYPFLPLFVDNKIVIVAEPFVTLHKKKKRTPSWFKCYGLGKGKNIKIEIEKLVKEFIKKMKRDYPEFIHVYSVDNIEEIFDEYKMNKYNLRL